MEGWNGGTDWWNSSINKWLQIHRWIQKKYFHVLYSAPWIEIQSHRILLFHQWSSSNSNSNSSSNSSSNDIAVIEIILDLVWYQPARIMSILIIIIIHFCGCLPTSMYLSISYQSIDVTTVVISILTIVVITIAILILWNIWYTSTSPPLRSPNNVHYNLQLL